MQMGHARLPRMLLLALAVFWGAVASRLGLLIPMARSRNLQIMLLTAAIGAIPLGGFSLWLYLRGRGS